MIRIKDIMELDKDEKWILNRMFEYLDYPEHWDDVCEDEEILWDLLRIDIQKLKEKLLPV